MHGRRWSTPILGDDTGAVTVEAAIALAAIVVAVVACIGALLAASTQVRCIDAAREAARLTARGDSTGAIPAARAIAPPGAEIVVRRDGTRILATVTAGTPLLPLLELRAEAVAAPEPGAES
ncbi:TadE family type IV pilus minor pilin [Nocardia cyriacigeorgica]|uniref:TadE family type IV pilus minor pilin n=1 Tax=Nocardia cyriacigeorgica TaxID=135487 RepID=UPI001894FCD5|nr:TadE family type IV pilus minor pilin [Nocardia cyriacigeorgica]MBF6285416.1 pilus assembly protein TadE [Nocardia cyriacigeorgica]MBF6424759.1 pilus assembly protein TadE [Nocardia cyriacigeorgica]BDU04082.1 hypothetical protein FMUBM48_03450 [Nocardia cyriacigeorgica]